MVGAGTGVEEQQGRWVLMYPDSTVQARLWNGKKHGLWGLRLP